MKFTSEDQRYDYPLTADSVVVDAGGYHGDFAATIAARYGCAILCFEPIAEFRAIIRNRNIPRLTLLPCALSNGSGIVEFRVNNDSTGLLQQDGRVEQVVALDVLDAFWKLPFIDLLKLNIEGGEYPVLRRMLDTRLHHRCRNIQVQFHRVANCEVRMTEIRERLSATHEATYMEDYVWENWRLKA